MAVYLTYIPFVASETDTDAARNEAIASAKASLQSEYLREYGEPLLDSEIPELAECRFVPRDKEAWSVAPAYPPRYVVSFRRLAPKIRKVA